MISTASKIVWLQHSSPKTEVVPSRSRGQGWLVALAGVLLLLVEVSDRAEVVVAAPVVAAVAAVPVAGSVGSVVVDAPVVKEVVIAQPVGVPVAVEVAEPLQVSYVSLDLREVAGASAEGLELAAEATDWAPISPEEGILLNNQLAYLLRSVALGVGEGRVDESGAEEGRRVELTAGAEVLEEREMGSGAAEVIDLAAVVESEGEADSVLAEPDNEVETALELAAISLDAVVEDAVVPEPDQADFETREEVQLPEFFSESVNDPSSTVIEPSAAVQLSATDHVYMLDELQPERRGYYDSLDFSGHLFSNKAANRFIIVDGKARAEQEALDETTVVEAITADGVILRTNGESVFVNITSRIN